MPCDPTPFGLWEAEENRLFGGGWEKPWRQDWPQDAPVLLAVGRRRGVWGSDYSTHQNTLEGRGRGVGGAHLRVLKIKVMEVGMGEHVVPSI